MKRCFPQSWSSRKSRRKKQTNKQTNPTYESPGWNRLFNHNVLKPHFTSSKTGLKFVVSWNIREDELSRMEMRRAALPDQCFLPSPTHLQPWIAAGVPWTTSVSGRCCIRTVPFSTPLCIPVLQVFFKKLIFCPILEFIISILVRFLLGFFFFKPPF